MIRMAILAGVSTDQQVEDKASIPDQISTCRRAIQELGGREVACWVIDGYSRTGYDSLADAMEDIPPLKQAIESASQNKYDVLMLDNWDRLGDLGQLVLTRFRKYRKQIYSARQPGRLHDPASYDPYMDEGAGINMHIQGIIQTYRINKMRRGWSLGVPSRIEKGLHPLSLPFGYRLTGPNQPAELVPERAALIRQMKDLMLAGETYAEIARRADKSNVPPPRGEKWTRQGVKRILTNPFYAGIVQFGTHRDRIPLPRSEWKQAQGRHEALWDESTYHALIAEASRRQEGKRNYAAKYPFTGLTVCGICGRKIQKHGRRQFEYLACFTHRHWSMRYEKAVAFLTTELVRQLKEYQAAPREPVDLGPLKKRVEATRTRRARVQEGYEAGLYNAQEAALKLNALQDEMEELLRKIDKAQARERTRRDWQEHLSGLSAGVLSAQAGLPTSTQVGLQGMIDVLPSAIPHGDPARINQLLTAFIDKIVLEGDTAQIIWRE